jgi:Ca2+-binding RTX toxin-like protein
VDRVKTVWFKATEGGTSMRSVLLAALVGIATVTVWSPSVEAASSIVVLDGDRVGSQTSLVLDVRGYPVVAYGTAAGLRVSHCNDVDCAGGDESVLTVDDEGDVGGSASLVLDAGGNPVVSYFDATNGHLKVAHCNDPNCSGDDESIATVDRDGAVGPFTSLELDASGNPVVSYHDYGDFDLKLLHCNDPNCSGDDESIATVESSGDLGSDTSLALDAAGNPVVSYYDFGNSDLKLVHCNDPDCSGDDESVVTVDSTGNVGMFTSLALDASGDPVVSYHDATNRDLKLVHCNDPNCSGGETSVTVDRAGSVGTYSSLKLDAVGNPVVSYFDSTGGDLKVVHCNDPDCAGADDPSFAVDGAGDVGPDASLQLDSNGHPVVSYRDFSHDDLKLAHCDNTICSPVTCVSWGATITGTAGNDVIDGTPGPDVVDAGAGDDTINGLAGDDVVCGGDGDDTISGGDGNDMLFGFAGDGSRADGADTIVGDAGDDRLDGGPGDDALAGGPGDDHLAGGEADSDDLLDGGPGADHLVGEGGVDTVTYANSATGVSADLATGSGTGDGTDEVFAVENLIGSPFDDTLVGDGGRNTIDGLAGDDVLDGAAGIDTVSFAASAMGVSANLTTGVATADGRDVLSGFEDLIGSLFSDSLVGDSGPNTIYGVDGSDAVDGAAGDDRLDGGDGNDIVFGSTGDDLFNGGRGIDNLNFAMSTGGVHADLSAGRVTGEGSDRVAGVEDLGGTEFADVLTGNAGRNTIAGGAGDDVIVGGSAADELFGDEGADRLEGGRGDDLAIGGSGADAMDGGVGDDNLRGSDVGPRGARDRGDRIAGGNGSDLIDGGIGNDVIAGGAGDDHLSGVGGVDTVTYADAPAGVAASLRAHRASGEGIDTLFGVENLVGSRFGDALTGSSRANTIRAGEGDDRLAGLAGNDALDGGTGFDRGDGGDGADTARRCELIGTIP